MDVGDIRRLLEDKDQDVLNDVLSVIQPVWGSDDAETAAAESHTVGWEPPPLDRRLTWTLIKHRGQLRLRLLADRDDSWATLQAEALEKRHPGRLSIVYTGSAQSAPPAGRGKNAVLGNGNIVLGQSIGHPRGRAGSIGALVKLRADEFDRVFAVTAAHVIALSKNCEEGDWIYSPGKPDCGEGHRNSDRIGKLHDFAVLTHYTKMNGETEADDITHSCDLALVDLSKRSSRFAIPPANYARTKNKRVKLTGPAEYESTLDMLGAKAFKLGRSTEVTEGVLACFPVKRKVLNLPNGRNYVYKNLIGVVGPDGGPISEPGDSGACLYRANGLLLGFLVGADSEMSLFLSAARALDHFKAELL